MGDGTKQAHHDLPRADIIVNHEVVQRATQVATNQGFHIDDALNGVPVDAWRNNGGHVAYSRLILSKLDALPKNLSPERCYEELMLIISKAKKAINESSHLHLNDINF